MRYLTRHTALRCHDTINGYADDQYAWLIQFISHVQKYLPIKSLTNYVLKYTSYAYKITIYVKLTQSTCQLPVHLFIYPIQYGGRSLAVILDSLSRRHTGGCSELSAYKYQPKHTVQMRSIFIQKF